ncbi:MAG: hypothetical protein NXI15_11845 [Gammaproteobacteria bacterium]|nr:hypothetical protein [Gammaproteobacteria bacterium]
MTAIFIACDDLPPATLHPTLAMPYAQTTSMRGEWINSGRHWRALVTGPSQARATNCSTRFPVARIADGLAPRKTLNRGDPNLIQAV